MPIYRNRYSKDNPPVDPQTGEVLSRYLDRRGREVLDSTPMEPPIGYKRTPSLAEQIRQMVQSELLARTAAEAGYETFDEAEDFDVGDDFDPTSPYEDDFDPPTPPPTVEPVQAPVGGSEPPPNASVEPSTGSQAADPAPKP